MYYREVIKIFIAEVKVNGKHVKGVIKLDDEVSVYNFYPSEMMFSFEKELSFSQMFDIAEELNEIANKVEDLNEELNN